MTAVDRVWVSQIIAAGCQMDFAAFVYGAHDGRWKPARHLLYVCEQVQAFVEADTGNAYDILLLEMPPQHGKSMTVTESLPAWFLGKNPMGRVILASYNDDTAERFCRRNKEKLDALGPDLFGVKIGSLNRATEFELSNGVGRLISRGIMGGITGNPAELILIDDPIKNRLEADSKTYRDRLWEEWQNSIKTRIAPGGKILVILTPWHEDDLRGRILQNERNVLEIRLPVEAVDSDPLGRAKGQPLFPEIGKDAKWLAELKQSYLHDPNGGARAWNALYMCTPRTEQGNLIRRSWWRWYDPASCPQPICTVISVDAAFKGEETSDFVSIQAWGKRENNFYALDCLNERLDFPDTLRAIRNFCQRYPRASAVLIEDKANGPAILSVLAREQCNVVPVTPQGGKVARVHAVSAAIESGHVFLPRDAAWTDAFVEQFSAFPNGKNDDMVDACTQALHRLIFYAAAVPRQNQPLFSDFAAMERRERAARPQRISII